MANSLTVGGSLKYAGNNINIAVAVQSLVVSVAGNGLESLASVTVPTTAGAIPLGTVASPGGWLFVLNKDVTNFMTILTGTGGIAFAKLLPGEFCLLRLAPGLTAPFWKADTATVQAELEIFDL